MGVEEGERITMYGLWFYGLGGKKTFGPLEPLQSHGMKEMGLSGPKWLSTG